MRGTVYKWSCNTTSNTEEQATTADNAVVSGGDVKLTKQHETRIRQQIIDKNPKQLKFDFALRTRRAVRELIKREF